MGSNSTERKHASGTAATVGTFDGFHRGHRVVVETLLAEARARGMRPLALSFDRHPLLTIAPERAPLDLTTPAERRRLITAAGVDFTEIVFTREEASLTAREFIRGLRSRLDVRLIVIGYDNTFGSDGRRLSADDYIHIGAREGVEVLVAPVLEGISSSAIRQALSEGDVRRAAAMLGRPYSVAGIVEHGQALGRRLGFPTANLSLPPRTCLPADGVYAAVARTPQGEYPAVVNVGRRPTVAADAPRRVEAHLIGFSGDLYGGEMKLSFVERLRGERKFDSLETLTRAVHEDIRAAGEVLKEHTVLLEENK